MERVFAVSDSSYCPTKHQSICLFRRTGFLAKVLSVIGKQSVRDVAEATAIRRR
jgi:hypothetical protein